VERDLVGDQRGQRHATEQDQGGRDDGEKAQQHDGVSIARASSSSGARGDMGRGRPTGFFEN
jgi:hypothetical protein